MSRHEPRLLRAIASNLILIPLQMNTLPIITTALLAAIVMPLQADDKKKAKPQPAAEKPDAGKPKTTEEKPAAEGKAELSKEQAVLKEALENHSRLKGFHVEVELKTPEGKATMSGSLGEGALSLLCTDVKGVKKKRVVAGGEFYLSADDGKTWKTGDEAEKDYTLLFNNIITAPVQMQEEIVKGAFTGQEEKLNGEDVLHLERPAKGKEAAIHFWLCKEPEMKNLIFLRKAELIVSGTDLELPATITYSKLTEPVKIEAPDAK